MAGPYPAKTPRRHSQANPTVESPSQMGQGRPRNTWRRTVLEEAKGVNKTWAEIKTDTKNRVRWRILGEALCSAAEWWDAIYIYTGCPRRNVPDFGRVLLRSNYTDITQNTYVQSWTVTEIMAREKCGLLAGPRTVPVNWQPYFMLRRWVWCHMTAIQLRLAINCICSSFRVMT